MSLIRDESYHVPAHITGTGEAFDLDVFLLLEAHPITRELFELGVRQSKDQAFRGDYGH